MTNRKIILYIVLLFAVALTAYIVIVVIPARLAQQTYDGAKRIGEDIRNAFQMTPQITVNNTVVLQQQEDILELALVSQKFRHEYDWVNTWMGSTKKISIKGTFDAKAGFNLNEVFTIEIDGDKAFVTVPHATLLSLTAQDDITFQDENGIWNWVNQQDRSQAVNAFTRDAKRYAMDAKFIQKAEEEFEKRIREIMKSHGKEAVISYHERVILR